MAMERLFEIQRIIIEQVENEDFLWRGQFDDFVATQQVCGILGARGVGKTTFLLRYAIQSGAKKRGALYVSADNIFFLENSLIDLVDSLYKHTNTRFLLIDEIHKYPNWRLELKNIVDTYPSFRIFFSGSSMIDLVQGKYDLSRRVVLHTLCGLSFREYLEFYGQKKFPKFKLEELLASHLEIAQELDIKGILRHFGDYLKSGYYPFFKKYVQEKDKFQSLDNAIQMTIYEDIGTLHSLKTPSLHTIEQLFKFVLNSSPGELNASKLATSLSKDFESISNYLKYLEQAGLIRFIYPGSSGQAALRNPIKMYPDNTNLIHAAYLPLAQDQTKGKMRETFVVNQLQNGGYPLFYSPVGDFKVGDCIFEVGGKGKNKKQIKNEKNAVILSDDILVGSQSVIPLYLFGFLY
jgi:predicted AAA+ superfamily ATPase